MAEEEPEVTAERRPPICMDCMGEGATHQPRAFVTRAHPGAVRQLMVPQRCQACRGTGKAGA